jgi:N-formylglutamate amidohydrolase
VAFFDLVHPVKDETPLVVEVPHAGLSVPPHFATTLLAPARAIARDADLFVDELYDAAPAVGASMLVSRVSRYVVDLNRAETDVDAETVQGAPASPRAPRGVVWRLTTDNERSIAGPLTHAELEARLSQIHRPYHEALAETVRRKMEKFGVCVILAAHSMPSVGRTGHGDTNIHRADVVPGTQGRTTAAAPLIDLVDKHAQNSGLSVKHDEPYRGGYTTRHWGRPSHGIHTIQVELARRLYMNEAQLVKIEAFSAMKTFATSLVEILGKAAFSMRA